MATIKEKEMAIKDIEEKITKTSNNERIKDWQDDIKRYKSRQTLEEIVGKYVFTADNFFKMILILLRIRANNPIILMGETGCGKTSLIKMLSKLLNNGSEECMKVKNINAGTTDDDIIDFIEDISKVAKKYEEEDRKEAEEKKN